jgi:pyrroline-5-carboxylate reductase
VKIYTYRIGFVGFGHMAKIICRSIDRCKLVPRSQILFIRRDPRKILEDEKEFGITSTSLETLVSRSDIILLCVRPGQAGEVLKAMKQFNLADKMLISLLAGARFAYFEKFLGSAPLIRAMPNIASEVGEGMTILAHGPYAGPEFRSLANLLFSSMGNTLELPEERMDIATGIAGSGPAYVLTLVEAFARAGEHEGIAYEKSLQMAAQTFLGAARILLKGGIAVEELLNRIAVPNGTTEAGLKVMKELEVASRLRSVIAAAANRSKSISEEIFS